MGTFLLIIQILGAIPTIISLIKYIREHLNKLPKQERKVFEARLRDVVRQAALRRKKNQPVTLNEDLVSLLQELKEASEKQNPKENGSTNKI